MLRGICIIRGKFGVLEESQLTNSRKPWKLQHFISEKTEPYHKDSYANMVAALILHDVVYPQL